jgi:hypothetical protein
MLLASIEPMGGTAWNGSVLAVIDRQAYRFATNRMAARHTIRHDRTHGHAGYQESRGSREAERHADMKQRHGTLPPKGSRNGNFYVNAAEPILFAGSGNRNTQYVIGLVARKVNFHNRP